MHPFLPITQWDIVWSMGIHVHEMYRMGWFGIAPIRLFLLIVQWDRMDYIHAMHKGEIVLNRTL